MARSSLDDVLSIGDPAQIWNFDFFLPNIPGSNDTRDLTFKCQTVDLPGSGLDVVEVPLHGVTLQRAGRKIFTHTINATFVEAVDWSTRDKFVKWQETARSWVNNSGVDSSIYAVPALIVVYDDTPSVVRTTNLVNLWPETINEVALDGSQSGLVSISVSFKYDLWQDL